MQLFMVIKYVQDKHLGQKCYVITILTKGVYGSGTHRDNNPYRAFK